MAQETKRQPDPIVPKDGDPFKLAKEGPGYKLAAHVVSELCRGLRWLAWSAAIAAAGAASGVPGRFIERLLS